MLGASACRRPVLGSVHGPANSRSPRRFARPYPALDVPVRTELKACARMDRHGVPAAPGLPFGRNAYTQRPAVREALLTSGSSGQASSARRNDRGHQEAFFSSSARRARSSANAFSPASLAADSVLKSRAGKLHPKRLGPPLNLPRPCGRTPVRACHNEIVAGPNGQRSRSTGSKGLRSWATLWPTQLLARRAHEPLKKMLPHRQRPTKWKEAAGCQSPRHHPLERGALHLFPRFNQSQARSPWRAPRSHPCVGRCRIGERNGVTE